MFECLLVSLERLISCSVYKAASYLPRQKLICSCSCWTVLYKRFACAAADSYADAIKRRSRYEKWIEDGEGKKRSCRVTRGETRVTFALWIGWCSTCE